MKVILFIPLLFSFTVALHHDVLVSQTSPCDTNIHRDQLQFVVGHDRISSSGKWHCENLKNPEEECEAEFDRSHNRITNVSLTGDSAVYKVYFGKKHEGEKTIKVVNDILDVPIHYLASSVVNTLMKHSFEYLYLTYNFDTFNNYLPNIGKLFRSKKKLADEMRDQISEYVLQKHATTSTMGEHEHLDYSCSLLKNGLAHTVQVDMSGKKSISEALNLAFKNNAQLLGDFTKVVAMADEYEDSELSEFVGHDLIFKVTEEMKKIQNMIHTIDEITVTNAGFGEFIFDKMQ